MNDWNQFRRDRHNSGMRRERESPPRPEVAWTVDLEGTAAGPPVLDRDAVYVGTDEGAYAYDGRTGRYRWSFRTDETALSPVRAGDVLAVVTHEGAVHGIETETGERRWTATVPAPVASAPAVHDGRVYVGHAEGVSAFAIDAGDRVLKRETDAETVGTPAIHDGRVYVGTRDERVLALELEADGEATNGRTEGGTTNERADGRATNEREPDEAGENTAADEDDEDDSDEPAWTAPIEGRIAGGPVVVPDADEGGGDRVYVADDGGLVLAMDAATGQSWFTYEIDDAFTTAPTVVDDAVFVAADDGYCHVTDTQFGTRKVRGWLFSKKGISLDGVGTAEPALVGGTLCLGDSRGSVYGIDVAELDFAWHVPLEAGVASGPAVADDGLYLGTNDGRLVRLAWGGGEPGQD